MFPLPPQIDMRIKTLVHRAGPLAAYRHLIAENEVKLALKTKRLPVTPGDEAARNDPGRNLTERFAILISIYLKLPPDIPLDEPTRMLEA